jgi:addiction module HigA family antidote
VTDRVDWPAISMMTSSGTSLVEKVDARMAQVMQADVLVRHVRFREALRRVARLTVVEAALKLGMSRPALSRVLNGHAAISTKLALTLEANHIGTAELWLKMQMRYDLEHARAEAR